MNRRTALAFVFVAANLMACCCGGFPAAPKAPANVAGDLPPQPIAEVEAPVLNDPLVAPIPKPAATPLVPLSPVRQAFVPGIFIPQPRPSLPSHVFTPKLSDSFAGGIDKLKVELTRASIDADPRRLTLTVRITNDGIVPLTYEPWNATQNKNFLPSAKDEFGRSFNLLPFVSLAAPTKIKPGEPATDTVAFEAPSFDSQEVDISLPHRNASLNSKGSFTFKIGRAFFAVTEDNRLDTAHLEKQRAAFNFQESQRRAAFDLAEKKAAAKRKTDDDAAAELAAAKKRDDDNARAMIAAEKAKAASRGVSRANYSKIQGGMTLKEVQDILGPGKESSASTNFLRVTWQGRHGVVSVTFHNGRVKSRSMIGD